MKLYPDKLDFMGVHHLITDSVVPRPIAWVSTVSTDGVNNLGVFSQYGIVCVQPPMVYVGAVQERDGTLKDTVVNAAATGEFVVAAITEGLGERMNITATDFPPEVDEFREARLTPVPGERVKAPLVGESPLNLECKLVQMLDLGGPPRGPRKTTIIIGEVVLFHVADDCWTGEGIDVPRLKTIARMGTVVGHPYCVSTVPFDLKPIEFGK